MILTIEIDKEAPGIYRATAHQGGVEVTEPSTYDSIENAIREEALHIPPDFAHFAEFCYAGMSTGTLLVEEVPGRAAELANRLVTLIAELHART